MFNAELTYKSPAARLPKLLLLAFALLPILPLNGQKASRQVAMQLFGQKKYNEAYIQFRELLSNYPADPLYKYYCGVCLVETEGEVVIASKLLTEAAAGSGAIRTVPQDCRFYLGRALQMSGKYNEAIAEFNRFMELSGKKISKELGVPEYIKQCTEGKGMIVSPVADIQPPAGNVAIKEKLNNRPAVQTDSSSTAGNLKKVVIDTLAAADDSLLSVVLRKAITEDSLSRTGKKIIPVVPKADTAVNKTVTRVAELVKNPVVQNDTIKATVSENGTPVFNEFSIKENPKYKPGDKIIVDPEIPAGLIYRIQVAVFRNPVAPGFFKGIEPVQGFKNPSNGITTYYADRFRKNEDATRALARVRSTGFRDAFVVAMIDRKPVSLEKAALLEKEWAVKPLYLLKQENQVRDTIPQTLVFRVEVKRSARALPSEQVEAMKKLAGAKGFDVVNPEPKQFVYLIGRFFTYSSALEFSDLLVRNGFTESKVVAWLGTKEIPVDTARKLFGEQ